MVRACWMWFNMPWQSPILKLITQRCWRSIVKLRSWGVGYFHLVKKLPSLCLSSVCFLGWFKSYKKLGLLLPKKSWQKASVPDPLLMSVTSTKGVSVASSLTRTTTSIIPCSNVILHQNVFFLFTQSTKPPCHTLRCKQAYLRKNGTALLYAACLIQACLWALPTSTIWKQLSSSIPTFSRQYTFPAITPPSYSRVLSFLPMRHR